MSVQPFNGLNASVHQPQCHGSLTTPIIQFHSSPTHAVHSRLSHPVLFIWPINPHAHNRPHYLLQHHTPTRAPPPNSTTTLCAVLFCFIFHPRHLQGPCPSFHMFCSPFHLQRLSSLSWVVFAHTHILPHVCSTLRALCDVLPTCLRTSFINHVFERMVHLLMSFYVMHLCVPALSFTLLSLLMLVSLFCMYLLRSLRMYSNLCCAI